MSSQPSADDRLERIIDEFEEAWQSGTPPSLEAFLVAPRAGGTEARDQPSSSLDASARHVLLEELIKIDLEYRWRRAGGKRGKGSDGSEPRLEDYAARYPELGPLLQMPLGLIEEEYRVRRQWGDAPSPDEYCARFPGHDTQLLRTALAKIDAEVPLKRSVAASPALPDPRQPHCPFCDTPLPPPTDSSVREMTCHICSSKVLIDALPTIHHPGPRIAPPNSIDPEVLPSVAGYEILELLGRGGMGAVYKARQESLNRVVALKMILAAELAGRQERVRFRSEAEAVAQLQHPNIVQIHEVGEQAGIPYFSLEYVEGGTLADKLAGTPQPARSAAAMVETLARAMHYAHEQGIVHRDLKPANILLASVVRSPQSGAKETGYGLWTTDYGLIPKITDFGLAKRLDKELGHTLTGTIMGTPSYMATEQAEGRIRAIGPATDVYGLGAILYEMLTGRPPFKGESPLDTLHQVLYVEPVSPIQLQPKMPRDLQTICLKCLEKSPADRYASAFDLAEDLRRFLVGEPILARPAGLTERVVKWARRRPAIAALVLVSSLAAIGSMVGIIVHNSQLQDALHTTEEQRARADLNLQKARQAVDAMLTEVGKKELANIPQMEPVRRALLEKALLFYQGFLQQNSTDPAILRETARVHELRARIYESLGRQGEMEEALRQALRLQEGLTERFPDEPAYRQDWAETTVTLSKLYHATGAQDQAIQSGQKAVAILERLLQEHPGVAVYQHDLATGHLNLGVSWAFRYRRDEAERHLQKALSIWESLLREHPDVAEYEDMLAECQINLGNLYREAGEAEKTEAAYRKAILALEHLVGAQSKDVHYEKTLALGLDNLGDLLSATQRFAEAKATYQRALDIRERLRHDFPHAFEIAIDLGTSYVHMANSMRDTGRIQAALEWYNRAVQILEPRFEQQPRHSRAREKLRDAFTARAETWSRLGKHAEAIGDWDRAIRADGGSSRDALRLMRATSLARMGDHRQATAEAKAVAEHVEPSGDNLYYLACVYALSAGAARQDAKLDPAQSKDQSEQYASHALELLAKAADAGFFVDPARVAYIQHDPMLQPITGRNDFKKWWNALKAKLSEDPKKPTGRK
ncbi:MAG TPA: protein kinase [Gemmataceae bacterium]|nr:protein kinase [Gemmataceae bacterium]